jgi:hypothetical protein
MGANVQREGTGGWQVMILRAQQAALDALGRPNRP